MLTEQTQAIIKSTAPLLERYGEVIAKRTYEILFEQYPQTKNLFSQASPHQPQKLAHLIIAYCENIDDLTILNHEMEKVSRRHIALDIQPGHYPMMGQSFLQAMADVLGDKATPEILAAWREGYFYLADKLLERERALYLSQQG